MVHVCANSVSDTFVVTSRVAAVRESARARVVSARRRLDRSRARRDATERTIYIARGRENGRRAPVTGENANESSHHEGGEDQGAVETPEDEA